MADPVQTRYLTDGQGTPSSMRLMCLLSLCAAIVFGAVVVIGKGGPDGFAIVIAFLTGAFGGKASAQAIDTLKPLPGQGQGQAPPP